MRLLLSFCTAIACGFAHGEALAQPMSDPLRDPMRPADARKDEAPDAAPSGPVLQVVITSPQRKLAVIDGAVVRVGDPVRGGKLAAVSDSVAVVDKSGSRDVVLMHPGIDKRPARKEKP
jgi:hypothetical protein